MVQCKECGEKLTPAEEKAPIKVCNVCIWAAVADAEDLTE